MLSLQSPAALLGTSLSLLSLASGCSECTSKTNPNITFDSALIPQVLSPLPAFSLGPPIQFSPDLLAHVIKGISPDAILSNTTADGKGKIIQIGDRAIGFVDRDTGATTFFPNYESLGPINGPLSLENFTHIDNPDLFPADDTIKHITQGPTLYQRQHHLNNTEDPSPLPWLQYFTAERLITVKETNFTIRGPGSTAIVGVGANAVLHAFNYLWHPAKQYSVIKPITVTSAYRSILAELEVVARYGPINVTSVDVIYYDSASKFIQPVLVFSATRTTGKTLNETGESILIQGYIPLGGKELEPLPSLRNPGKLTPPDVPAPLSKPPSLLRSLIPKSFGLNKRLPSVTVGRYVIRDSEDGFLTNAQQFGDTLAGYSGSKANFLFTQYYWAYNWLYTTYRKQFANAVNILLTEAHGNWHRFRTSPGNDRVYINDGTTLDIPQDGYGGGSGGSLAYWIIHACEVLPMETDYPGKPFHSFDYWWSIFNGLHAVMGFRTEGLLGDGMTVPFAKAIAQGVGVVPAWMSASLTQYKNAGTYEDGNRGGLVEPFGRGASVSVCGHTDDVVWNVGNLGRPGCLWEWWYEN